VATIHSLSSLCQQERAGLVPLPDRRQISDRRRHWRGGRRLSDFIAIAHLYTTHGPATVHPFPAGISRDRRDEW
jgi:hypothetical protein